MTMNQENNFYCRFENFCCHFLQDGTNAIKEKSWDTPIEDVYVEYFTNIDSLKRRVLELYDVWMNKHQLYDKPERVYFPGFIIFNLKKDYKVIGFCPQGWYLSCSNFLSYIYSYVIALNLSNIKDIDGKKGRTGRLEDGRTVDVRETSSDGRPTLEIIKPNNRRIKFRFND